MNELVARVRGMIMAPAEEWRRIAAEPVELAPLFTRYVMILAAIPAVAGVLWLLLWAPVAAVTAAVVGYVLSVVSVFVVAKIVEILAPNFGAPHDPDGALKLAAFSPTAAWVSGAAMIVPVLGWLVALIGALYSLYTLYLGVPIVTRVPQQRAAMFTLAVIGVAILVQIAVRVLMVAVL